MLRTFSRHLFSAVFAGLMVWTVAGGIEGYSLYLADRYSCPIPFTTILNAVMYAVYAVLLGGFFALLAGAVVLFRKKSRSSESPLFGSYLSLFLYLYALLFIWCAYHKQDPGSETFSLLAGLGASVGLAVAAFLLSRLVRRLENRGPGFATTVGGLSVLLLIAITYLGFQPASASEFRAASQKPAPSRPNMLLVLVDTLRADHLGCYGYERDTSPSIDALAADGVLFKNCISQCPWTKPAVASILTSTVPPFHGVVKYESVLSSDFTSLPDGMSEYGYRTALISASVHISRTFGFGVGADWHASDFPNLVRETKMRSTNLGSMITLATSPVGRFISRIYDRFSYFFLKIANRLRSDVKGVKKEAVYLNDSLLDFIDESGGSRIFAYLHYMEPHGPYSPDPPFDTLFMDGIDFKGEPMITPPRVRDRDMPLLVFPAPEEGALEDMTARYDGEIADFSSHFEKLIAELKERGLYDDMLIFFVSDHGEEFYDHRSWGHAHSVYDELINVPLIVKFPGNAYSGTVVEERCDTIDILPTILDFMGVSRWEQVEGRSLLPLVKKEALPPGERDYSISCAGDEDPLILRCYIEGKYKVTHIFKNEDRWFLFNLEADPEEKRSLTEENPELFAEMRRKLEDFYKKYDVLKKKATEVNIDFDMEEKLKALGYIK